jgi:hypothetical protein
MVPFRLPLPLDNPDPALVALTVTALWFEHFTVEFVVTVMDCDPVADGSMLMLRTPFTAEPHCDWTVPFTETVGAGTKVAAEACPANPATIMIIAAIMEPLLISSAFHSFTPDMVEPNYPLPY